MPLEVVGKNIAKHGLLTEDTEDGASATAHGGIGCAKHVQLVANTAYNRMRGEYTCLEIVHHPSPPSLDRLRYDIVQGNL